MIHQSLHPGKLVKETCVTATGLSVSEAAKCLGIDRTTFSRLINGHASISPEMAIRLSEALGTSASMWLGVQRDYDLWKAESRRKSYMVEDIENE